MAQLRFDKADMCIAEVDTAATSLATVIEDGVAIVGSSLVKLRGGTEAAEFPAGWFCPRRTYHDVTYMGKVIKTRVDLYDWRAVGNRLWWDAKGVLPFLGYPSEARSNTAKLVPNCWGRWALVGNNFWYILYLMRRAASPKSRSKDQGPFRMSDVDVLGSHGLRLLLAWRAATPFAAEAPQ